MNTAIALATLIAAFLSPALNAANHPLTPSLVGDWWTIARDPDLGALTTPNQQPVDFGIWQAADGTWQLWSCIRGTKEPGKTRLFHRWEGAKLTDTNWTPRGIAMHADPVLGETQGGLQAPYVIRHQGKYWMFYGDWANICLATSDDGKTFTRHRNAQGKPQLNFPGAIDRERNGRDPMVRRIGNKWYCYYTAHPGNKGFDYARTSDDLLNWSEERVVAARGKSGDGPYSAECPFVAEPQPGHFCLFRTQRYGKDAQTMVYHSRDPLDFGIDNDAEHYVTTLPVAAPEIFQHEGQWYLAALLPSLKGIQVCRLRWAPPVFPGKDWETATPESEGVNPAKLKAAMDYLGEGFADYGGIGTVVIVRNGRMIWAGPECDKEFQIFSATKSFVSTVLGLLIQDHKVSLDTLGKDLDSGLAELYPAVTLRHFATMTSGYDSAGGSYEFDSERRGDSWNPGPPAAPLFPPGSKFRYWDDAMSQFGSLLTKAAGAPLDRVLKSRIADPIGMTRWRWTEHDTPTGRVLSFPGGIWTSSRELARFGHLFLNRGHWNGRQLIDASWVDQATSVQVAASVPNDTLARSRGAGVYGYNWWVNGVKPDGQRLWPGAPPRTYYANGLHNNVCIVIPEWNMVVARTNGARKDGSVGTPSNVNEVWSGFFSRLARAIAGSAEP